MPRVPRNLKQRLRELAREDDAQDLVEYALLAALVGVAGTLAFQVLTTVVGATYQGWDSGVQGLWEPRDPV